MRQPRLTDDQERPLPDTIWWCETGQHFDLVHKASALDLCCTCHGGVAELRSTTISGKTRRRRQFKGASNSEPVYRRVASQPLPEGFALNDEQREALAEGRMPGISFPKTLRGSLAIGSRYEVADNLSILVTGLVEEKLAFGVFYRLIRNGEIVLAEQHDPRSDALPKAFRGAWEDKQQQQAHDAEPEAEPISIGDVQRMTDDTRTARIEAFRASLHEAEEHLQALRARHPDKSRLFWPVNEEIKRISKELSIEENVARDLPLATSGVIS